MSISLLGLLKGAGGQPVDRSQTASNNLADQGSSRDEPDSSSVGAISSTPKSRPVEEITSQNTRSVSAHDLLAALMHQPQASTTPESLTERPQPLTPTHDFTEQSSTGPPAHLDHMAPPSQLPVTSSESPFVHKNAFDALDAAVANTEQLNEEPESMPPISPQAGTPSSSGAPEIESPEVRRGLAMPAASIRLVRNRPAIAIPDEPNNRFELLPRSPTMTPADSLKLVAQAPRVHDMLDRHLISVGNSHFAFAHRDDDGEHISLRAHETNEIQRISTIGGAKVINLSFAPRPGQEDSSGLDYADSLQDIILSTDVHSNVAVHTIQLDGTSKPVFMVAGPSDSNHKIRAKWSPDGSHFALSITSRLYVFRTKDVVTAAQADPAYGSKRVKLHSETRHASCLCICKADKAIKDFAISEDCSAVVGVDKNGSASVWPLRASTSNLSALDCITTADQQLLSIEFLSPQHIVCGTQYNDNLFLLDLAAGRISQTVILPKAESSQDNFHMSSKLEVHRDAQLLAVNRELEQGLYIFKTSCPVDRSSPQKTIELVEQRLRNSKSHKPTGRLTSFHLVGPCSKAPAKLLSFALASIPRPPARLFVATTEGVAAINVAYHELSELNKDAQIAGATIRMSPIEQHRFGSTDDQTDVPKLSMSTRNVQDSRVLPEQSGPAISSPAKRTTLQSGRVATAEVPGASRSTRRPPASRTQEEAYVTEPRNAEAFTKIETNLKTALLVELKKQAAQHQHTVEQLQAHNETRHKEVLKLVSQTLSQNTTALVRSSVVEAIETKVLPAVKELIKDYLDKSTERSLQAAVDVNLNRQVPGLLRQGLLEYEQASKLDETVTLTLKTAVTAGLDGVVKRFDESLAHAMSRLEDRSKTQAEMRDERSPVPNRARMPESALSVPHASANDVQFDTLGGAQERLLSLTTYAGSTLKSAEHNPIRTGPYTAGTAFGAMPITQNENRRVETLPQIKDMIVDFIMRSQHQQHAGGADNESFVRSFLAWQPAAQLRADIASSLSDDQLTLFSFLHALSLGLNIGENVVQSRLSWLIAIAPKLDARADIRVPAVQVLNIADRCLTALLERGTPASGLTLAMTAHARALVANALQAHARCANR
ncbi:hypothetical protein PYCC9005_002606 [Savitreella phatthalungensis]